MSVSVSQLVFSPQGDYLAVASGNHLATFECKSNTLLFQSNPVEKKEAPTTTSASTPTDPTSTEKPKKLTKGQKKAAARAAKLAKQGKTEQPEGEGDDDREDRDTSSPAEDCIRAISFTPTTSHIISASDDKRVIISHLITKSHITYVSTPPDLFNKKMTALATTTQHVLVSDKIGDVYRIPIPTQTSTNPPQPELLLGTCSHITQLVHTTTPHNNSTRDYVIVSDGDGQIRVYRYPETYVLYQVLLAHQRFVTSLALISPTLLISGGDNHILHLWDWQHGQLITTYPLDDTASHISNITWCEPIKTLVVATHPSPHLYFFTITDNRTLTPTSHPRITLSSPVASLTWHPTTHYLWIITESGDVQLVDSTKGSLLPSSDTPLVSSITTFISSHRSSPSSRSTGVQCADRVRQRSAQHTLNEQKRVEAAERDNQRRAAKRAKKEHAKQETQSNGEGGQKQEQEQDKMTDVAS